jgi:hypothetical protein
MKLYELIIIIFFAPAFWFGWMWAFRLLAMKAIGSMFSGLKDKLKGENSGA